MSKSGQPTIPGWGIHRRTPSTGADGTRLVEPGRHPDGQLRWPVALEREPSSPGDGAARVDRLQPGDRCGRYRIVQRIGRGGMADVYEAVHPFLERRAALKVARCDDQRLASFERLVVEAQVLWDLRHAAVAEVFDVGVLADGTPWFAMELLDGETLATALERGPLDLSTSCRLIAAMAAVLRAAHGRGVIHRDLKPENVILEPGPEVGCKLIDWGIARVTASTTRHTEIGLIAGTPGYMSPEQARGDEVDSRSDVYALGCCAYEMCCGRPPFVGKSSIDVLMQHVNDPPLPLRRHQPELPAELERVVLAMLAKSPDDRPTLERVEQVMRALADELPEADTAIDERALGEAPTLADYARGLAAARLAHGATADAAPIVERGLAEMAELIDDELEIEIIVPPSPAGEDFEEDTLKADRAMFDSPDEPDLLYASG